MFDSKPRAQARMHDEKVIWLTTVRPNGRPQASPVWFLVDGEEILVYSLDDTARIANLEANPKVALNLDGNGQGGDIVTIEGTARIDRDHPPSTEVPAYQEKYATLIARNGWTPERFAEDYPVPIRITVTRTRAW
jgi:PPOX class probable F420-dependent enzyme